PVFDHRLGTVTAGNSSQISDGAAMLMLTRRDKAEAEGWPLLGRLIDWRYAGCDPARMGLGPVFSSHQLLSAHGLTMADVARVEINEAFATQMLACQEALASKVFHQRHGLGSLVGAPDDAQLNIWGGAIAIGHPVGMTGARLILSLCHQLKAQPGLGLATLCIGGGQGAAVLLEAGS
ncbi:MAG: acetyl-CoA C-acyltransferase, partial [Mariprofundales bacterium]